MDFNYLADLLFPNVVINNNRHVANCDGIDICGSSNVVVKKDEIKVEIIDPIKEAFMTLAFIEIFISILMIGTYLLCL